MAKMNVDCSVDAKGGTQASPVQLLVG